ncbi:MAG: hypothetical protein FJ390_01755 [Verrucomicrobia bacterium]|nr:hypothetical protein [Verrucomicrobiota bacterium]
MSSRSDYGELENDSKEFENAALFNHGGLGLVVAVEENQGGNVLSAESAIPTLNRSLSRQCVLTPVELSNERVLNDTHLPPPPSFGRYTIRTLQRNISKIVGEEHEPGGDEAAITPDIIPGNLKKADSAVSDTDYGDIVDEESGEHQDVILEVPSSSAADERSHSLRFSFKQDQRQPSQRNLAQQSSSKILAQAASDLVASEEAKIGENDFSEPSASAALEGTMKELPLVKPAILAPPAELYRQLSQKEQSELDNGKMIAVETKGESYKSYGITYYKPSTFTAYYLLDADERSVADLYWDPSEATAIFPNCVHVSRMKNTSASAFVNYTFQVEANVPFIGRQVFQETVSMKNDRFVVEGQEEKISFENTNEGTYLKTFKGSFSIVPHQDKLLAAYEVTTEFKGVAGQLITNDAIRNIVYTVLLNLINRARVSK